MASRGPNPKIVTTSPPPNERTSTHLRRPLASQSVSLKHSPLRRSKHGSQSSDDDARPQRPQGSLWSAGTDSPSSLQPLGEKHSSGESSNAEKWFEKSNNEVRDASFTDNEPPFFMRNSSSSETPPEMQHPTNNILVNDQRADSLPLRTGMLQLGTDASSTEDFRGVIDDLTVQNKKLKRKLRKYEELHDAHLKDQKLFEVRIHGLPAEKKQELEETLRKFAASLDTTGENAFPKKGYASLLPMLKAQAGSSSTSLQNADSAYASMSGQGSSAQSGNDRNQKMTPTQYMAARRQNINSYLHDIPEGLLPQQSPAEMTEHAKQKYVVRRVEQLFVGKGAAAGEHHHSLQQQEVSHSAARADRSGTEATGQRSRQEGSREAHIMEDETEDPLDLRYGKGASGSGEGNDEQRPNQAPVNETALDPASKGTTDQRPTRPLDLDPHRAQVPDENIRYMRHLGFSPLDPGSNKSPEDGHSWIYLNFLTNMAQLHTINVTTEFVRKAISEFSNKLQVSNDGRKVRWRGGRSVTHTTSGASSNERADDNLSDEQSPRKRPRLMHRETSSSNVTGGLLGGAQSQQNGSKHRYTPLFAHRDETDNTDDSSSEGAEETTSSPILAPPAADSSAMTSSGARTTSGLALAPTKKRKKPNDGPIIFYNNARFCTDLSGDPNPNRNYNVPAYTTATSVPIGKLQDVAEAPTETRGPLAKAFELPEPMHLDNNPVPESMELSFPQFSPLRPDSLKDENGVELEVTGIGGVWPVDNFSISVDSRHARIDQAEAPNVPAELAAKSLPPRFAKILQESSNDKSRARPAVHKQVLASQVRELPPSELPQALSYMPFGDESTSDDESDADESMSDGGQPHGALPPSAAPQPIDFAYASPEDDEYDDDDDDEDSDGEVDFLAAARQIDPDAVREREREYDANMAERLAEEIPAGSSAATAGGGSGFASPASGVDIAEHKRASRENRAKASMNISEAVGSQGVQHMQDVSSSDDEDDEMSDASS